MTPEEEMNVSVRLSVLELVLKYRSKYDSEQSKSKETIIEEAKHYEERYIKGGQ